METPGKLKIGLTDESVDVVLLLDVFHSYYFPQAGDRRRLLGEIYRIMKPSAFISVWPKHTESETEDEIKNAESDPIYNRALQAAKEVEKGNEQLSQVLIELQGAR